jgi:hypothetical protein
VTSPPNPKTTVTTVRELDQDGQVIRETVTTTVTETVKQPDPPSTGLYL